MELVRCYFLFLCELANKCFFFPSCGYLPPPGSAILLRIPPFSIHTLRTPPFSFHRGCDFSSPGRPPRGSGNAFKGGGVFPQPSLSALASMFTTPTTLVHDKQRRSTTMLLIVRGPVLLVGCLSSPRPNLYPRLVVTHCVQTSISPSTIPHHYPTAYIHPPNIIF